MSDYYISLIPCDPEFVPSAEYHEPARVLFHRYAQIDKPLKLPVAVSLIVHDAPEFINPMANLGSASCPDCGTDLNADERWGNLMDAALDEDGNGITRLIQRLPCCGKECSLNDLVYDGPAGFSRFVLQAENPNRKEFSTTEIAEIEKLLGCKLKQIWTHI